MQLKSLKPDILTLPVPKVEADVMTPFWCHSGKHN